MTVIRWYSLLLPCRTVQPSIDAALNLVVAYNCSIQMMGTSDEIGTIVYHVQILYLSDSHFLAIELNTSA